MKSQFIRLPSIIAALMISTQVSFAATYRYKENAPPAKMMLDMMEVMGVIERVPDSSPTRSRTWPVTSLWGMSPGMPGQNAPWLQQGGGFPQMMSGGGWPMMSYPQGMMRYGLNPYSQMPAQQMSQMSGFQNLLPQNSGNHFRYQQRIKPEDALWATGTVEQQLADDQLYSDQPAPGVNYKRPVSAPRSLDGSWVDENNQSLQIRGNRFVWRGESGSVNSGTFTFDGSIMTTSTPNYSAVVRYQIEFKGDWLIATNESGIRYQFRRFR